MLALVLAVIVYLAGIATGERSKGPRSRESPAATSPAVASAEVVRVIDGDTIEVRIDGDLRRVRYIGIDTPERDECYRQESTSKNEELVGKKRVRLERDVSETDRFGRLLRYVYAGELFVNAELVRLGYANVFTDPPDVKFADHLRRLEQEARTANRGLWDPKVCAA